MKRQAGVLMIVLSLAPSWVLAQEAAPPPQAATLQVEAAVIARAVEDREPLGQGTQFEPTVGRLFCHTRILGAEGETAVYHVWRHGPTERAKVRLSVRGPSWRTWSSKRIAPEWTGPWTVEVQDAQGTVLETVSFTVGPGGDDGP